MVTRSLPPVIVADNTDGYVSDYWFLSLFYFYSIKLYQLINWIYYLYVLNFNEKVKKCYFEHKYQLLLNFTS